MPIEPVLIHATENLRFYRYSTNRYYVYTVTGIPIGDIYYVKPYWVYEPTGSTTTYPYQWLDDISLFLKYLSKETQHE